MRTLVAVLVMAATPAAAFAQAAIVGTVRDSSGGPMGDVTVEAISPALIEKARTATTDPRGRYRIERLHPGTYSVRFTRPDWRPYQLNGIELTGAITVTVDAELSAGALSETVTVTPNPHVIDAHSARRELTLAGDTLRSLPTARTYNSMLVLVPGVLTSANDTVTATASTSFPVYGGRTNEGRLMLGGLTVGSPPSGNSATSYAIDVGSAAEVTFIREALGEAETGGLVMNIVPKSGGNARHGSVFVGGTGGGLQWDNLTPELVRQGVTAATPLTAVYDVAATFGGPLMKDRLWYLVNGHLGGSSKESPTVYYNGNAGRPDAWLYAPDLARREYSDRTFENASTRLTWHVTPRNTVAGFVDAQALCRTCTGATPGLSEPQRISPEAVGVLGRPLYVSQATWSSPITDRLLAEAGFGGTYFGVGNFERQPNPTRGLVRVVEQCASGCDANGNIAGLVYRSQDFSVASTGSYLWKGSLTWVRGAHSFKAGYQHTFMTDDRTWMTNDQNLTYRVSNGVPNQLTQSISPWVNNARLAWGALFGQDEWTYRRLTLQGAMRFDRSWSWFPAQQEGPTRFLPVPILIPETRGVDSYKDVTPRIGAAYDLGGDGRTVLRVRAGKYLEGAGVSGTYANTNPTLRMPQTTPVFGPAGVTRAWTDANHNFVADCDLLNPAAQDLRASGGDACGVTSNTRFGQAVLTNSFDRGLLKGWNVRPSDWDLGMSLARQMGARSAVEVTYTRRWFHGFSVVDNGLLEPSDLTLFSVRAPADARLPGGGGYLVSGLYDVVPEKAGQVENRVTDARNYGSWVQRFDGIDLNVNARVGKDLTVVGGTSTGRTLADNCDVRARVPELSTTTTGTSSFGAGLNGSAVTTVSPYCHVAYGVLTQVRGLATYQLPKGDIQVSAVFQSKPGAQLAANYAAPNAAAASSLGRPLSGNAQTVTVNLVAPGTMYGDRVNQLDLRLAKRLRHGRWRTLLALDVYNALNSSAVLTYDNTFVPGGAWLQPLTILTPRFLKLSADIDF
jgi:hypothetical protein